MRPHVICHMLCSVDGKIDATSLKAVIGAGDYEATGAELNGDAWICGRTTMQHFADDELASCRKTLYPIDIAEYKRIPRSEGSVSP